MPSAHIVGGGLTLDMVGLFSIKQILVPCFDSENMSNKSQSNPDGNIGGETGGVSFTNGLQLNQTTDANTGETSDRDEYKGGSTQSESEEQEILAGSSDGKTSTQPDTNDDTTSDDCKLSSTSTIDVFEVYNSEDQKSHASTYQNKYKSDSKGESFSMQLMHMLTSEACAGTGNKAVEWLPDGSGFVIRNQQEFEQNVIPRYFDGPCVFQSFVRRLYRWGFKQIDKSTAGSGQYVFKNEVFHRDNDSYQKMKPLPRSKKESQDALQGGNSQDQRTSIGSNTAGNPGTLMAASHQIGHFPPYPTNALSTERPRPVEQVTAESIANGGTSGLPSQLASAQNELVQLVNTIVSTYSSSPVLLSSLQNDMTNLLQGIPPAQLNTMQQQTQQNGNQEPVASIIDGVIKFLTQRQGALPPPALPGQPLNFLPPSGNIHMLQQQGVSPPLSSSLVQGYSSQMQQIDPNILLNNPNMQSLWGHQAQLHQHAMQPYGPTPPINNDSAATTTSSSNDRGNNVDRANSETSLSNDADESTTFQTNTQTEGQVIPPRNTKKRERSPSLDE